MTQNEQAVSDSGRRAPQPPIHGPDAFAGMRKAGRLTAEALDILMEATAPGVTTDHLDKLAYTFAMDHGAYPASLLYRGYPKSICTSINHVVCHGIPGPKKLLDGDIVNIDITTIVDGWHGDTSRMFLVGKVGVQAAKLVDITYECMMRGIELVKPGIHLGEIGHAIQTYAEKHRYSVVRDFCGHGIGRVFHDSPSVLHFGRPGNGAVLKAGMFFTVEPMINAGRHEVKILDDGWTAVTRDKKLSAQFEHTIAVTDTGYEIFTLSPKGWDCPPYAA